MAVIALIVGNPAALTVGDTRLRDRILAAGHTVTLRAGADAELAVAEYGGYLIAESVDQTALGTKYAAATRPGIVCEHNLWVGRGFATGTLNVATGDTSWNVTATPGLDGGLTGTRTIYTTASDQPSVQLVTLGSGAIIPTRRTANTARSAYFAYDTGATMASGTAPARRVALGLLDRTLPNLAADGQTLLDAAISWTFPAPAVAPNVDAGPDVADHPTGTQLARTATNSGGAVNSWSWAILSGPAGVGSTIGSAAALAWTPTVAGAYVLRVTAVGPGGTDTDDVAVTVTTAAPVVTRRNRCTNPALAVDAAGWTGAGWTRTAALAGMARPTGIDVSAFGYAISPPAICQPGQTWTVSCEVLQDSTGPVEVNLEWRSDGGFYVAAALETFTVSAGVPTRVYVTATAPAEAGQVLAVPYTEIGARVTAVLIERTAEDRPYFDGDTVGASWDGTPGASSSTLTGGSEEASGGATVPVALGATGTGRKTATGAAQTAATLDARGSGRKGAAGAAGAGATLTAAGTGRKRATGRGTVRLAVGQASTGRRTARGGGLVPLVLTATGVAAAPGHGTAPLHLAASGTGRKRARGRGGAALALPPATADATRTAQARATIALALDTAAAGHRTGRGRGVAPLALTGTADGPTERAATGTAPAELAATGTGRKATAGTGRAGILLGHAATGHRSAAGTGRTGLLLGAIPTTGPRRPSGRGTARLHLAATGTGVRAGRGRGVAALALAGDGDGPRATTGSGGADLALAALGDGARTATGAAAAGLVLATTAEALRTARGTATSALELATAGTGDRAARTGGAVGLLLPAPAGAGARAAAGAGTARLVLELRGTAGAAFRSGRGRAALALRTRGRPGGTFTEGRGAVLLALDASGTGRRHAAGRGRSALVLTAYPRRRVRGTHHAAATGRDVFTPTATGPGLHATATAAGLEVTA